MCYVNTLPKRPVGKRFCVPLPTSPTAHDGTIHTPLPVAHSKGVDRGKLMRLPTSRYRPPLSRASLARGKRESPRWEVSKFKRPTAGKRTRPPLSPDFNIESIDVSSISALYGQTVLARQSSNYFKVKHASWNVYELRCDVRGKWSIERYKLMARVNIHGSLIIEMTGIELKRNVLLRALTLNVRLMIPKRNETKNTDNE